MHIFSVFLFLDGVLRDIPFNTSERSGTVVMDQKMLLDVSCAGACTEFG